MQTFDASSSDIHDLLKHGCSRGPQSIKKKSNQSNNVISKPHLDFFLLETMLPDSNIRRDAILAVIQQYNHAIRIHALTNQELVILEAAHNLFGICLRARLKSLDLFIARAFLLEPFLDLLHVGYRRSTAISRLWLNKWDGKETKHTLEMTQITLLVEARLLQPETMRDIEDGLGGIVEGLLAFFSGRVGANVDGLSTDGDPLTVGFVDDAVNLFEVVRVGDDFVAGDKVLVAVSFATEERFLWVGGLKQHALKIIMLAVERACYRKRKGWLK